MANMSAGLVVQLGKDTVQLISCSQVITSVHSVVKELVENSLDAESTSITIRLENYGLDVIEVRDNGVGVKKEDIPSLASPHSTSKITTCDDLSTLKTYGFRGEALSSMARMASLSVTSRTAGDDMAMTYHFSSSGEVTSSHPTHLERGVSVMVSNLFKHMPVRRQCYKKAKRCKEELKKVEDYLLAFGISHPEVRFLLRHNKHTLWQKLRAPDFQLNVTTILGVDSFKLMSTLNYQCFDPMVKIRAFVPQSHGDVNGLTRSTPDRIFLLVNKRPVVIKPLIQVVKQAFAKAFPSCGSRYPMAVLCISVLPHALDVNLEPNKTTVLLHDLDFIVDTLDSLLKQHYSPCKLNSTILSEPTHNYPTKEWNVRGGICTATAKQDSGHDAESNESVGCNAGGVDGIGCNGGDLDSVGCSGGGVECSGGGVGCSGDGVKCSRGGVECSGDGVGYDRSGVGNDEDIDDATRVDCNQKNDINKHQFESEVMASEEEMDYGCGDINFDFSDEQHTSETDQVSFQTTLSQWSKGRMWDHSKPVMEPVKVCTPHTHTPSTPSTKRQPKSKLSIKPSTSIFDMINSQPVKRKNAFPLEESNKKSRQLERNSKLTFDLTGTVKRCSLLNRNDGRECKEATPDEDRVIGKCEVEGERVWLVVRDNTIACFDANRANESRIITRPLDTLNRDDINLILNTVTVNINDNDRFFHDLHNLK